MVYILRFELAEQEELLKKRPSVLTNMQYNFKQKILVYSIEIIFDIGICLE